MKKIKYNGEFDLDNTITCGQIFRFNEELDGSYTIIITDRVINLKILDNILYVESNNEQNIEEIVRTFLDLDRDYNKIIEDIKKKDSKISKYLDESIGLKIIKQEPIECIIEYIISQNNSVRNIARSLNLLSEKYGEKVIFKDKVYYLFPTLETLYKLEKEDFRKCGVGFRDKYLYDIIKSIKEKKLDIDIINNMSTNEALEYLKSFKGIGNKVASCILLFAYLKFDVFPIDTWVKKFMLDNYNISSEEKIKEYCKNTYKEYSGLAIQYMFNSKRNKN